MRHHLEYINTLEWRLLTKKILDIGCGNNKTPGAIGVDFVNLPGVDIVCDLNKDWPIEDSGYDQIIFRHSMNHFNDIYHIMKQAHRVLKKGGLMEVVAPHFSSDNIFTDPTVKFFIGYRSFDYFCDNVSSKYHYYSDARFILNKRKIFLYKSDCNTIKQKIFSSFIWPFDAIINSAPRIYEKFFCFIFRANEIVFELKVK